MTKVYRLLRAPFAATPFDGEGAYQYGGRWSRPGIRITYTAQHRSLAMIEYLVHLDPDNPPADLVLAAAEIPDSVSRSRIPERDLPPLWRRHPAPAELAAIGDDFIRAGRHAILIVPSALAPPEENWLLNPAHPAFTRIRIHPPEPFRFDPRFFSRSK